MKNRYLSKLENIFPQLPHYMLFDSLGLSGVYKSMKMSIKHTDRFSSLIISSNTITEIDDRSELDINTRLGVGVTNPVASHPHQNRSVIKIKKNANLQVTATDGPALIGPGSVLYIDGDFSIGRSYITADSRIVCENSISIGDGCAISWNTEILDTDRQQLVINGKAMEKTDPIQIEDNVWIGHDVGIKKGVTIGKGAVIASHSVVTSDIPSNSLAAGTPAEVIKDAVSWQPPMEFTRLFYPFSKEQMKYYFK
jgi:acetyltransferase-like isoleucine patch superfamily enzyme